MVTYECPAPQPRNKKTFATPKDAQHALDPAGTAFKSRRSSAMPFESSMSSSPSSSPAMTSELSNLSAEVEKLQRMAGSWTDDKGVSGDGMASSATATRATSPGVVLGPANKRDVRNVSVSVATSSSNHKPTAPTLKSAPESNHYTRALNDERVKFLKGCLEGSGIEARDRIEALSIVEELHSDGVCSAVNTSKVAPKPNPSTHRVDDVDKVLCCEQSQAQVATLTEKLALMEERLSSVTALCQNEAKVRASMSDLYDKEFFRVGQDMAYTSSRIDRVPVDAQNAAVTAKADDDESDSESGGDMADASAKPQSELAEEVKELEKSLSCLSERFEASLSVCDTKATNAQDLLEARIQKLSSELADLVISTNKGTADITAVQSSHDCDIQNVRTEIRELKIQLQAQNGKREEMEGRLQSGTGENIAKLQSMKTDLESQYKAIDRRLTLTEEEIPTDISDQLAELRAMTTDYDSHFDRISSRIAQLEKDVGDGLNDSRLIDAEFQIEDLISNLSHLFPAKRGQGNAERAAFKLGTKFEELEQKHGALVKECKEDWDDRKKKMAGLEKKIEQLAKMFARTSGPGPRYN